MPTVRVKAGTYRDVDGVKYERGDTVEMTDDEWSRVNQRTYDVIEAESDYGDEEVADESADEAADAEASGDLPSDWNTLRKMAVFYEGDEVNGSTSESELRDFFGDFSNTEIANLKTKAREELES